MIIHNSIIKELNGKDAAEISVNQYDGNKIPHHTMHNQGKLLKIEWVSMVDSYARMPNIIFLLL